MRLEVAGDGRIEQHFDLRRVRKLKQGGRERLRGDRKGSRDRGRRLLRVDEGAMACKHQEKAAEQYVNRGAGARSGLGLPTSAQRRDGSEHCLVLSVVVRWVMRPSSRPIHYDGREGGKV